MTARSQRNIEEPRLQDGRELGGKTDPGLMWGQVWVIFDFDHFDQLVKARNPTTGPIKGVEWARFVLVLLSVLDNLACGWFLMVLYGGTQDYSYAFCQSISVIIRRPQYVKSATSVMICGVVFVVGLLILAHILLISTWGIFAAPPDWLGQVVLEEAKYRFMNSMFFFVPWVIYALCRVIYALCRVIYEFCDSYGYGTSQGVIQLLGDWAGIGWAGSTFVLTLIYVLSLGTPLNYKLDVIASSGDLSSDILWSTSTKFYNKAFLTSAMLLTHGPAFMITGYHFGKDILKTACCIINFVALTAPGRLEKCGIHQIFEEHAAQPEKFLANLLGTVFVGMCVPLGGILGVAASLVYIPSSFAIIMTLHSVRALPYRPVLHFAKKVSGADQDQKPLASDRPVIDTALWNLSVAVELLCETVPSTILNFANYKFMNAAGLEETMSWTSFSQVLFSLYTALRLGYKYLYYWGYMGYSLLEVPTDIPVEQKTETEAVALTASAAKPIISAAYRAAT